MSHEDEDGSDSNDSNARDERDEIDRRAILRRRAVLVSAALAGVSLSVAAPAVNPVCVRDAHAQRAPRAPRRDAATADAPSPDSGATAEDASAEPSLDEMLDVENLPHEVIDATVIAPVRPHVCLSPIIRDEPPSCGCRRTG